MGRIGFTHHKPLCRLANRNPSQTAPTSTSCWFTIGPLRGAMQAEGVGGGERSGHHHPPVRERATTRGRIEESGGAPRERDGALTPEADEGMRRASGHWLPWRGSEYP